MIRQFHTPDGIITRELTQAEIENLAKMGDLEARLETTKQKWNSPEGIPMRQDLIARLLGIEEWV